MDLLDQPGEGARPDHARAGMYREAADVQLVDDGVFERGQRRGVAAPVVSVPAEDGPSLAAPSPGYDAIPFAPDAARDQPPARIEQHEVTVEAVAWATRPVHAPAIAEGRGESFDQDVPEIAGPVPPGVEGDLGQGLSRP